MKGLKTVSTIRKIERAVHHHWKRPVVLAFCAVATLFFGERLLSKGPASATASLIRVPESAAGKFSHAPPVNPVLDWLAQPKKAVQRNLFAINFDDFDKADAANSPHIAKSSRSTIDRGDAPQQSVMKLNLQATIVGSTPCALVNGELVKEGDIVQGFTVVKIHPQQITVEQDGVTLEVAMP